MGGVSVASGYATSKMPRLPAQGHSSAAAPPVPIRAPAEGALGRLALEALAAGDSPRCCQSGPSGVLPGRVHFPLQSSPIQFPGQAVLSPASTGCRCRTGALQRLGRRYLEPNPAPPTYSGYWSQINTPLTQIFNCREMVCLWENDFDDANIGHRVRRQSGTIRKSRAL